MARTNLRVAYDGPALSGGKMDVRDLAPALLAISELCDESFRLLNGHNKRLRVEVQASFKKGSFGVTLDLVGLLDHVVDLFSGKAGTAISNLMQMLGFVGVSGATVGVGLIQLVRKLRGRPPKPSSLVRLDDGTVRIDLGDESLIVREDVLRLYADVKVRNALAAVIAPLAQDGIDSFETRDAHDVTMEKVVKDEVLSFAPPQLIEEEDEQPIIDRVQERAFGLLTPTFQDGNKWRLSDGDASIYATMEDQEFLAKINSREEFFVKGDVLVCSVRLRQFRSASGLLRNEFSVLKVLEHKHAPRQQLLKLPSP
jgi:hypothetical protein